MGLALAFELRIEERGDARVVVSALLAPEGTPDLPGTRIDGVALQLVSRTGDPIGVQMLLPIAGELRQPMLSTVELKAGAPIPLGCRVIGTAWHGSEQREASIPTDPFTELEAHMRARRRIDGDEGDRALEPLERTERARIAKDFPWIDDPRIPVAVAELTVVEGDDAGLVEDEGARIDDLVDNLGLDAESSDWLRDLLHEDDDPERAQR